MGSNYELNGDPIYSFTYNLIIIACPCLVECVYIWELGCVYLGFGIGLVK